MTHSGQRVVYYYDTEVGNFHYGGSHPMKPFRINLTHDLMINYGLYHHMRVYRPRAVQAADMTTFHGQDYIAHLQKITPENWRQYQFQMRQFCLGPKSDCPIFDGMFEFSQRSIAGSLDGALRLAHGYSDIAINWAGGFHHAKKSESAGFCYVNDIVLAILELLKYFARVLYIDIDVHHGDGVEEAFYATNRVLCWSLHKHGNGFFPGTGHYKDIGAREGKHFSVNFPFDNGIDDANYLRVFKQLCAKIIDKYQPSCIVLQCGADSLTGDRIGVFNLSTRGHGSVIQHIKSLGIPLLCIGGGGYTIKNVARCWTYETSLLCGHEISNTIPYSDFMHYFKPEFKLHIEMNTSLENKNTKQSLEHMTAVVLNQIKRIEIAPSVQISTNRIPMAVQNSVENARKQRDLNEDSHYNGNMNSNRNSNSSVSDANSNRNGNSNHSNHNPSLIGNTFQDFRVVPSNALYADDTDQDPGPLQTK